MPSRTSRSVPILVALALALSAISVLSEPAQAARHRGSLTVSPATAILGEQVSFSGAVPSKRVTRPVLLQRLIGRRWVSIASARTTSLGGFRLISRAPSSAGQFRYRVLAPRAHVGKKRMRTVRTPVQILSVVRQSGTLTAPATGVVQTPFNVSAKFSPARLGRSVDFQQLVGSEWKRVASGRQDRFGVAHASVSVDATTAITLAYRAVALGRAGAGAVATRQRVIRFSGDPAGLPQPDAADTTPRVVDDDVVPEAGVRELRQVGSTMYVGGDFHLVRDAANTSSYIRTHLFSFDATGGAVTGWAPVVNGPVYSIESSADGRFLFIGGDFSTFDGVAVNRLVKYDLQLHAVDESFVSPLTTANRVSDLQIVGTRLFVAGTFAGGIVALDPATGARTPYFDPVQVTGSKPGYSTRVYRFAVNPTATRLVVIGSFTAVGGAPRQQVAMIRLDSTTTTTSPWASTRWDEECSQNAGWYTRAVGWSPDGAYFAVGTTGAGYPGTAKLCDTVSRWNPIEAAGQQPAWTNYTGGDTIHSLVITEAGVFVGGHFRWLDNPLGRDFKGSGAVDRPGLGALNPATGKAYFWNPTKGLEGGLGAFDLYFTGRGLWVAHFENTLGTGAKGTERHEGLGLLPF
jgi:hypothetical protein